METLQLEKRNNYGLLTIDRGRSNPMNLQMIEEIIEVLKTLKNDDTVKGLIITGKENFFSAGLDLPEIMTYDRDKTRALWQGFMDMIVELVSFPKPLIAAITGHAPAGGCIIAISCDYRIMAGGEYKIGLNEVPVGIVVPEHIYELYAFWIGRHRAYQFLLEGRLMKPQQASDVGMVDIIVPESQVIESAERKMKQYLSFDQETWSNSKMNLRKGLIQSVSNYDAKLIDNVVEHWFQDKTQEILNGFVALLKKK